MFRSVTPIGVMIVDDHPMICEGIAAMIAGEPGIDVVAEANDGAAAVQAYRRHRPDVTLMDLQLPGMNGIDAITAIRQEFPQARILVMTTFCGDVTAARALAAGAVGFVMKSALRRDLLEGIRRVNCGVLTIDSEVQAELANHQGLDTITPREAEVLQLVAQGHTNRAVALRMSIKEETVKTHMRAITAKLGVDDRTHAVTIALRRGIIVL